MGRREAVRLSPVMGNEEECGVMHPCPELIESLRLYMPEGVTGMGGNLGFRSDGRRVYTDNMMHEITTPECGDPKQLAKYIQGTEVLAVDALQYALSKPEFYGKSRQAVLLRRVIDDRRTSWGSQNSFSVSMNMADRLHRKRTFPRGVMLGHLATRSFMTGTGYVGSDQIYFAQKPTRLVEVEGYSSSSTINTSSMFSVAPYRTAEKGSSEPRVEDRCGDINLSAWAARIRAGSAVLALAMSQTPYARQIYKLDDRRVLEMAHEMNRMELREDGSLADTFALQQAVAAQQQVAELSMEHLADFVHPDTPEDLLESYLDDAREVYGYCDDTRRSMNGDSSIDTLADRSDNMAKMSRIHRHMKRDKSGKHTSMTDDVSRSQDLGYDRIVVSVDEDGQPLPVKYGWGYMLREKGQFRDTISAEEAELASRVPPEDTRAAQRAKLIKRLPEGTSCDWDQFYGKNSDGKYWRYYMTDVLATEPDEERLAEIGVWS